VREIKFRAWDGEHILLPFYSLEDLAYRSLLFENKNLIWMQYTGIKDKNGKEIFEGDIIYLAGYGDYFVEFPFIELYDAMLEDDIGQIKGNIHENPELLK